MGNATIRVSSLFSPFQQNNHLSRETSLRLYTLKKKQNKTNKDSRKAVTGVVPLDRLWYVLGMNT